jgi:hypothetical protein
VINKHRHIRPAKRHIYRYAKRQNKTMETIAKIIRILTILFYVVIFSLSFYFVRYTVLFIKENEIIDINPSWNALTGKTKIMEFKDPNSRESNRVYFVISNPPEKEDSLLNLVSEHFRSYAPNDTIKKYGGMYVHEYYKETWNTRYDYKTPKGKDFGYDYISRRGNDLLVMINVWPELNKCEIELYKKGYVDRKIKTKWK